MSDGRARGETFGLQPMSGTVTDDADKRDAVRGVLWRYKKGLLRREDVAPALAATGLLDTARRMQAEAHARRGA